MIQRERDQTKMTPWRCQDELDSILPERKIVASRGSIDRYGFLYVLASRCGRRAPRRAFAEWVHGWIWDDKPNAESLACNKLSRTVRVVVRTTKEQQALRNDGFADVVVGGLPFAYVDAQHVFRNSHALLAIPPHSAEAEKLNSHQQEYMDYLESLKSDFDGIYVSIFHLDWNGPMHRAALARGLNVIQGARPDDANSLYRTRALFEAFTHVTSNTMGSHFVYALHSGCRFSFSGPLFKYDPEMILGNGNPHGHSRTRVERLLEVQDEFYLRKRFGRFFVDHPMSGVVDVLFGAEEVGLPNLLSVEEINNVVGWTPIGQVQGYARGAMRRINRVLGGSYQ